MPLCDGRVWAFVEKFPPELLGEIIRRVGESSRRFPDSRNVLACASVCKRWREITKEIVRDWAPLHAGGITFLSCLKRPGPRDLLLHCVIERDLKTSTFYLYLSLSQGSLTWQFTFTTRLYSKLTDKGKFLLAARRYWRASCMEYIISCSPSNFSRGSDSYIGKLSSDVPGINFTIFEGQASCNVAHVSYKVNLREPRGPRSIVCSLKCHSSSDGGGAFPIPEKGTIHLKPKEKQPQLRLGSSSSPSSSGIHGSEEQSPSME